jgi:hypothetical protein
MAGFHKQCANLHGKSFPCISDPERNGIVFGESVSGTGSEEASAEVPRSDRISQAAGIFLVTRGSTSFVTSGRVVSESGPHEKLADDCRSEIG